MLDASRAATARVRELSRGGRRKNEGIDAAAAAAASVAAPRGDASVVVAQDDTVVCALLVGSGGRSGRLSGSGRPNQLHALCGRPDCGWCTDGAQGQHSCGASPQRSAPRHHQKRPARPWRGTWYPRSGASRHTERNYRIVSLNRPRNTPGQRAFRWSWSHNRTHQSRWDDNEGLIRGYSNGVHSCGGADLRVLVTLVTSGRSLT